MTPPDTQTILRRRARDLARPLAEDEQPGTAHPVMRFRLRDAGYAVPLLDVRRVVTLTGAARLPRAALPMVALGSVVGRIVPVVDLGASGGAATGLPPWGVAVASRGTVICLPADAVTGVDDLRDADITPPSVGDVEAWQHVRGLTLDGHLVIDVAAVVASIAGAGTDRRSDPVIDDDER